MSESEGGGESRASVFETRRVDKRLERKYECREGKLTLDVHVVEDVPHVFEGDVSVDNRSERLLGGREEGEGQGSIEDGKSDANELDLQQGNPQRYSLEP